MASLNGMNRFRGRFLPDRKNRGRGPARRTRVPSVEPLEGRQLLSTFTLATHLRWQWDPRRHAIVAAKASSDSDAIEDLSATNKGMVSIATNAVHAARVRPRSRRVVMGRSVAVTNVRYYTTGQVPIQPVSGWQGIRDGDARGQYLIAGTSGANGLLFIGTIAGRGKAFNVIYPGSKNTSVYGPNNLGGRKVQLVGAYKNDDASTSSVFSHGFLFEGTTRQLQNGGGVYRTIDHPGAKYNYVHSVMGGLAVGNYDGPARNGEPIGPGRCYIYNTATGRFVTDIVVPGSVSNTAYGIWHNGGTSYTIAGGYTALSTNNLDDQHRPIGLAYLVDYDSATGRFSRWTAFAYPNRGVGGDFVTHFEGISSPRRGVYTLAADSVQAGSENPSQGSFVTVRRNRNGSFGPAAWVNLNYTGATGLTSSNSVAGNQVVGIVISSAGTFSYQATVNP